jgi:hypothetical protein
MLYHGSRRGAAIPAAIHQVLAKRVEMSLEDVRVLGDLATDFPRRCCVEFGRRKPKKKSGDD